MYKVEIDVDKEALISTISDTCCTVQDSYRLWKSKDIVRYLQELRNTLIYPTLVINVRTIDDMAREWKVHNLLYALGIEQERSKSVDLECPQSIFYKMSYTILS